MATTTLAEAMKIIGRTGTIRLGPKGELMVVVTIHDFKNSYGKERWLVRPVGGSGEMWVETVTVDSDE